MVVERYDIACICSAAVTNANWSTVETGGFYIVLSQLPVRSMVCSSQ